MKSALKSALKKIKPRNWSTSEPSPRTPQHPPWEGGGGRGRGRRGSGRGRPPPRPTRGTPYQEEQLETMVTKIIERMEQRRGGRSPKPHRPPRESTYQRHPHGSGGTRARQDFQYWDRPPTGQSIYNLIIISHTMPITHNTIIPTQIIKDSTRVAKEATTM